MANVKVTSTTQRIIVASNRSVSVVNAGPVGPRGFPGSEAPSTSSYEQLVVSPTLTPLVTHNLGFRPVGVIGWYQDDPEQIWQPAYVNHVNDNALIPEFILPFEGRILVS